MIRLEINKRFAKIITILVIGLVLFLFNTDLASANTGINPQIPYSGNIVKNDGTVLDGESFQAKFIIYNSEVLSDPANIKHQETRNISIRDGRFEVLLGESTPITVDNLNEDSLWIELQLNIDTTNPDYEEIFSPRKRIGSALYSINSMRLVANGGTSTNTLSLDSTGNLVFNGFGSINLSAPSGFDRVIIANSSGQFSQVNLSSLTSGYLTTSTGWALAGNDITEAWNGTSGSRVGTTSPRPLVLATTNAAAQDIQFFTGVNGANERMRILGTGNIGIGTTNPSQRLQIEGGNLLIGIASSGIAGQLQLRNPANTFQTNIQAGAQTADITYTLPTSAGSNLQVLSTNGSGVLSWITTGSSTGWALTGNSGTNPTSNYIGTSDGQALSIRANGSERMRILSNVAGADSTIVVGNFEGTTSSTANRTAIIRAASPSATGAFNTAGGDLNIRGGYSTGNNVGGDIIFATTSAGSSSATPNNYTERMRILGNGNIDINTTVAATTTIGNTVTGTSVVINSGSTGRLVLGNLPVQTSTSDDVLLVNASNQVSRITRSNLVNTSGWALTGNSGTNPTSNYIGTSDEQTLSIRANGRERMRILSNVAGADSTIVVGDFEGATSGTANRTAIIRAASPSATGAFNTAGGDLNIRGGYSTGNNVGGDIIFATTSAGSSSAGSSSATPNNYTERMRILGNGNIDINTTVAATTTIGNTTTGTSVVINSGSTGRLVLGNLPVQTSTSDDVLLVNASNQVSRITRSNLVNTSGWALTGNSGTNPTSNYIGTSDGQALSIRANGSERMRILSNVAGADSTIVVGDFEGATSGTANRTAIIRAASPSATGAFNTAGGDLNIRGGYSTGNNVGGDIIFATTSAGSSSAGSSSATPNNYTERMRILGNGNIDINTTVAATTTIGNTTTGTSVVINSGSTGRLVLGNLPVQTSTSDDVLLVNASNQVSRITRSNLVNTSGWALTGNSGTNPTSNYIGTSDGQALSIRANGSERMRILSASSGADSTIVVGDFEGATSGTANRTAIIRAASPSATGAFNTAGGDLNIRGGYSTGNNVGGDIIFATTSAGSSSSTTPNNYTERMRILGNGNINLGNGNIDINTTVAATTTIGNTTTGTSVVINSGSTGRLVLGNLPVQTSTSDDVLLVNASNQVSRITRSNLVNTSGWALTGNSGTNPTSNYIGTSDGQALSIRANGSERMRILSASSGADSTIVVGDFEGATSGTANRTAIIRAASPSATGAFNTAGGDLNIRGGYSTGNNVGGDIIFATTSAGSSSSTTPNNYTERMRILGNGNINLGNGNIDINTTVAATTTIGNTTTGTSVVINSGSTGRLVLGNLPVQTSTSDDVLLVNASNQVSRITRSNLVNTSGWALTGNSGTNPTSNYIGTSDGQALSIRANGSERMRILSASSGADSTIVVGDFEGATSGTANRTAIIRAASPSATGAFNTAGGDLNIRGGYSTGNNVGGDIIFATTSAGSSSSTTPNNYTERMRILGNGNINLGNGNIDINTTVAATTTIGNTTTGTSVVINSGSTGRLVLGNLPVQTSTSDDVLLVNASNQVSRITRSNLVNTSGWALTGNSGTNPTSNYIGTSDGQALSIRANGSERMRILSASSGADSTIVVGDFEGATSGTANRTAIIRAASPSATGAFNTAGGDLNIRGGYSTGNNVGGDIIFATTSAGSSSSTTPNNYTERMRILGNGNININTTSGSSLTNIGRVVLSAGTATANTAPLKFTAGTNLTTAEAGAVEWNGTNLFLTTSGGVRQTINQGLTATATLDFPSTNDNSFNNLTVTVTGAVIGDVVTLGIPNASVPAGASNFTAWVSTTNTVTVRFSNHSGVAQDPASGSFKIFVTKF